MKVLLLAILVTTSSISMAKAISDSIVISFTKDAQSLFNSGVIQPNPVLLATHRYGGFDFKFYYKVSIINDQLRCFAFQDLTTAEYMFLEFHSIKLPPRHHCQAVVNATPTLN